MKPVQAKPAPDTQARTTPTCICLSLTVFVRLHVYGASRVPRCSPLAGERSHSSNESLRSPLKACAHPTHTPQHGPLHVPLGLVIHVGTQKKKKRKEEQEKDALTSSLGGGLGFFCFLRPLSERACCPGRHGNRKR